MLLSGPSFHTVAEAMRMRIINMQTLQTSMHRLTSNTGLVAKPTKGRRKVPWRWGRRRASLMSWQGLQLSGSAGYEGICPGTVLLGVDKIDVVDIIIDIIVSVYILLPHMLSKWGISIIVLKNHLWALGFLFSVMNHRICHSWSFKINDFAQLVIHGIT